MKKTYAVTITDSITYYIKAASKDDAEERALEWYDERMPEVYIEETNEEPDVEI